MTNDHSLLISYRLLETHHRNISLYRLEMVHNWHGPRASPSDDDVILGLEITHEIQLNAKVVCALSEVDVVHDSRMSRKMEHVFVRCFIGAITLAIKSYQRRPNEIEFR